MCAFKLNYHGEKLAGESMSPGLVMRAHLLDWGCSGVVRARFWEPLKETRVSLN